MTDTLPCCITVSLLCDWQIHYHVYITVYLLFDRYTSICITVSLLCDWNIHYHDALQFHCCVTDTLPWCISVSLLCDRYTTMMHKSFIAVWLTDTLPWFITVSLLCDWQIHLHDALQFHCCVTDRYTTTFQYDFTVLWLIYCHVQMLASPIRNLAFMDCKRVVWTQQAHNHKITLYQRRHDLIRRCFDVMCLLVTVGRGECEDYVSIELLASSISMLLKLAEGCTLK